MRVQTLKDGSTTMLCASAYKHRYRFLALFVTISLAQIIWTITVTLSFEQTTVYEMNHDDGDADNMRINIANANDWEQRAIRSKKRQRQGDQKPSYYK